jgi:amino acid adenylation domain-containing protein
MTFSDYLQTVKQVAVAVYQHQNLPFQSVLDSLPLNHDLSHRPLFQCFFLLQNFELPDFILTELEVTPSTINTGTAKFDLTLELYEKADGLQGWFEYNTDLFKAETITRLVGHLQTLLTDIVAHPQKRLSALRLLTETERHFLATCGNTVYPTKDFIPFAQTAIEQSIPSRFAQQVTLYPAHLAIVTENYRWSYPVLEQQVQTIAQTLFDLNTAVEEKIALLFAHDAPMIAALLGVLTAGKTYCPLDPEYPTARLQAILQDLDAQVILTDAKYLAQAEQLSAGQLTVINVEALSALSSENVLPPVSPDTVAYVLYTSASTGQPKGVLQNHRNVLHFMQNYTNNLHICAEDRLTLLASYSFDAAVMDIFGALLNGATLYPFAVREVGLMPLATWLAQEQITLYHSTPTVYRHFIETLEETISFPAIRLVVLGGEAVYKRDFDLYCQHFTENCLFVNGLGPTESTVSLQYIMAKHTEQTQWAVPVGYPVANTEISLLDETGEETEIYGEITIKSAHVALGYWRQKPLTDAVFFAEATQRRYRMGDLGRLRAEGSLEFVGRKDLQVKVRGYRIELGEIEATLVQHPAIMEAAVTLHEESQHLIAYIVQTSPVTNIRHFLTDKLPAYMIPSDFIVLDQLPLTATGKVDRRALPIPKAMPQTLARTSVKPRDTLEMQLTRIWEQVLKIQPIGVHDNFFELGGHSLRAITLLAQIEKTLHKRIPLVTLFREPTIARLAHSLREEGYTVPWYILEPIKTAGFRSPLFFIGSTSFAHTLAPVLGLEQPVYGLNIFGLQDAGISGASLTIKSIAKRYIQEIRSVQTEGPYCLAGYCADAMIALEMAQQLHAQNQKVAFLAFIDTIWQAEQRRYSGLQRHWHNLRLFGPNYLLYKIK